MSSDNIYFVRPVVVPIRSIVRVVVDVKVTSSMDSAFIESDSSPCFVKEYDELLSQYTGYSINKSADYYYNQYYTIALV